MLTGLTVPGIATADGYLRIDNVTLIDGTGRAPLADVSVLVDGERIAAIGRQVPDVDADKLTRIDGTSKYLIPGLIDSHIHLRGGRAPPANQTMVMEPEKGIEELHGYLYSGVTAVYDSGNNGSYLHYMRDAERAGEFESPRIFATVSLISVPDGHGCCAGGITVTGPDDGAAKLARLLEYEPDLLKFTRETRGMGPEARNMPLLPPTQLADLITQANEHGVRTTVHVSEERHARAAIAAGANAFAHMPYLDEIDEKLANLIAARGVVISTTLARNVTDVDFFQEPAFRALLWPAQLERELTHHRRVGTPYAEWLASLRPTLMRNVRQLYDAGAILAAGTDRTFGAMPHAELMLLVEAGIPPLEAIKMSTLNGAIYIGVEADLGSIEVGKLADMVLLEADPSVDIKNSMSIDSVFKGGRLIDRSKLDVVANQP